MYFATFRRCSSQRDRDLPSLLECCTGSSEVSCMGLEKNGNRRRRLRCKGASIHRITWWLNALLHQPLRPENTMTLHWFRKKTKVKRYAYLERVGNHVRTINPNIGKDIDEAESVSRITKKSVRVQQSGNPL